MAPNNLEECKNLVDTEFIPVEPEPTVSLECFDQNSIVEDKMKHDRCVACCENKINEC